MKPYSRQLFLGAAVACFFTLTLVALAQDEKKPTTPAITESPATAPVAAAPAPADQPAPVAAPAATPATPVAPTAAPAEAKAPELRRLDEPTSSTPAPARARNSRPPRIRINNGGSGNGRVAIANDVHLGPDERADAVVAIAGSATSEGEVADAVVSVMGSSTVTAGSVGDAVVSVLGNTYVNTKIGGEAVAVMGDVELGPNAEIGGDVVSVGGTVKRDPNAIVHGNIQNVSVSSKFSHLDGLQLWFRECALLGRPLGFNPKLQWAWGFALGFLALYVVLALLFGNAMTKCAVTLETRPGGSILTALLTLLLTPVLIVLLCVTVVGIAVVPFLGMALVVAALFGKAVMLTWVGRCITRPFGSGVLHYTVLSTLIGGFIVLLLYTVPFVGMTVQKSFDVLGLGVVVYTLLLASKREKPAAPMPPAGGAPFAPAPVMPPPLRSFIPPTAAAAADAGGGAVSSGFVSGAGEAPSSLGAVSPGFTSGASAVPAEMGAVTPLAAASFAAPQPAVSAPVMPPVVVSAAMLPRAGFWIRVAALGLDGILILLVATMIGHPGKYVLLLLAAYGAVMWKLKGTTIGGVVCGLKVVRVDDRELDWATAIVRALGCFLSLAVVGLGFIWVAVDDDKQSWHDKIAGTTVVRMPKGTSLL